MVGVSWIVWVFLAFEVWWMVGISEERLPPEFPLFYSLPRGKEQLGRGFDLWLVVGVAAGMLLFNQFFSWKWRKLRPVLAWSLLVSGSLGTGLLLVSLVKIYMLVGW